MTGLEFVLKQGWNYKESGVDQLVLDTCPICQNTNSKFYINSETGLWDCKVCGAEGNLFKLKTELGLSMEGATSVKDVANSKTKAGKLPDLKAMHTRLLMDEAVGEVLDYLISQRKFNMDVIDKMQLGASEGPDKDGNPRLWYVIPYLNAEGNAIFYKKRSVPTEQYPSKNFGAPVGYECPLYNESVLRRDMDEVVFVEGESDCLSLMSQGYYDVVGIPGAAMKKAAWIEKIDKLKPKAIYICYDNDEVGQKAARLMASRIGLDLVKNIVLPEFIKEDGTPGKDLNEWFVSGKTINDFKELQLQAKPFEVIGIQNLGDVLSELKNDLINGNNLPKYSTPWPSLNKKLGGLEDGDLLGIMAEAKIGKTTFALNLLHYYAQEGHSCLMYCQEMPPKRMVRKWASYVTGTDDTPGASKITPGTLDQSLELARVLPGDLLFGFTTPCIAKEVIETIKQAVRRYGVKVVCFDNLQMLVRSLDHSAQETSVITKQLKQLAMELDVLFVLIIQPHRVADGQIISSRNAMGSSAIEKDVDYMICLHRNRIANIKESEFVGIMETETAFDNNLLVKVDLGRYAPGGICTLYMDGGTSSVREIGSVNSQINTLNEEAIAV